MPSRCCLLYIALVNERFFYVNVCDERWKPQKRRSPHSCASESIPQLLGNKLVIKSPRDGTSRIYCPARSNRFRKSTELHSVIEQCQETRIQVNKRSRVITNSIPFEQKRVNVTAFFPTMFLNIELRVIRSFSLSNRRMITLRRIYRVTLKTYARNDV